MTAQDLTLPTKSCHNCRRRRWKCDRSLPVCQKCLHSGADCLGYGKLFVWNQGVASRGKMMGKSFEEMASMKKEGQEHCPSSKEREQSQRPGFSLTLVSNPGSGESPVSDPTKKEEMDTNMPLRWSLIDPLVKDLNRHSRYYLFHFATQLCGDMVIYDGPGHNPIRDLIPATSAHPLLLQVMIANSAFHVHNLSRELIDASIYQANRTPCLMAYYRSVSRFGGPFKSSYRDALIAKQRSLSLLSQTVTLVDGTNFDVVLVSILLLINYDLIESGKDSWKVHMEGARKLISLVGNSSFQPQNMSRLRTCLLSDMLVFFILGSTLTFSSITKKLLPDSIDLEAILKYAETNNYLSCPDPLLRIMLMSFELPDTGGKDCEDDISIIQDQVKVLLEAALAFDPEKWAVTFQPASPFEDLEKRTRIASAHRSAACLYIARVLPGTSPLISPTSDSAVISLPGLANDILHHLSYLNPSDKVFKSIGWPIFLAGAESDIPAQQKWIMEKLDSLWNEMFWGYILNVKEVLKLIWKCKERTTEGEEVCWVDEVKRMGTELLIA
ncbi:hypothetical protein K469DRAFT_587513 [Zopfia rhizophila CBS 207.26]|uniref:Zn(2)-C6 fungal-type domain-containing protein n=1 Tax=Zopfia rhizophila CBS 207.26 TaxID=1314779 RepID=A0A6A6DRC3_9PEZI|nr:hypothetical protein K469DRAFT_587513 [Zopfia rhizophila CBS 207.26]